MVSEEEKVKRTPTGTNKKLYLLHKKNNRKYYEAYDPSVNDM